MKLILGNPGSGKTRVLLEMSARDNIPVLCESRARVERLLVKADGYGLKIPSPVTMDEVDSSLKAVYVDDIQRLIEETLNVKLKAVTVNREDSYELVDLDNK